uniref:Uncharacterized protein n=1 Tax=Pyropia tenera TaxID=2785 RepID=A0A0P0UWZ9_PYRTE|nr:hypothetical protein [Neopyropia tenera]
MVFVSKSKFWFIHHSNSYRTCGNTVLLFNSLKTKLICTSPYFFRPHHFSFYNLDPLRLWYKSNFWWKFMKLFKNSLFFHLICLRTHISK